MADLNGQLHDSQKLNENIQKELVKREKMLQKSEIDIGKLKEALHDKVTEVSYSTAICRADLK